MVDDYSTAERVGTGYAITPDGRKITYAEATEIDRAQIADANTTDVYQYVNGDGKRITNWPGGELMRIIEHGTANTGFWGSTVHYIRAVAPDGSQWYGRNGGNGMSIHLKRAKS